MEQKHGKNGRQSYGAVILILLMTCLAVGCISKQNNDRAAAQSSTQSSLTETHTSAPDTTSAHSDTTASRTDTTAPETTAAPDTTAAPESTSAQTARTEDTTSAQTPAPASAPSESSADRLLTLVNRTHAVPEGWTVETVELRGGVCVDAQMYPALQKMFDDMRAQGINPFVREGYRTREYQEQVMQERINTYLAQGCGEEEAKRLAEQYVALPGTSEHELGLAVDINADEGSLAWTVYRWLAKHAQEYGFILRYPEGKTEITGIEYEPWHYRYVGVQAAKEITESGLTLEEYLGAA